MKLVILLFAAVMIGIGLTLLPPVETVTGAIFDAFGGTGDMPALLALVVSAWPILFMLAIFFGAYALIKGRSL